MLQPYHRDQDNSQYSHTHPPDVQCASPKYTCMYCIQGHFWGILHLRRVGGVFSITMKEVSSISLDIEILNPENQPCRDKLEQGILVL